MEKMRINEDIILFAFRYALGRKTYAVSIITDHLKNNWKNISNRTKDLIECDIERAIKHGEAGMEMDVKKWKEILKLEWKK